MVGARWSKNVCTINSPLCYLPCHTLPLHMIVYWLCSTMCNAALFVSIKHLVDDNCQKSEAASPSGPLPENLSVICNFLCDLLHCKGLQNHSTTVFCSS